MNCQGNKIFKNNVRFCQNKNGPHNLISCLKVNREIDKFYNRWVFHHKEGAEYFRTMYGKQGFICAKTHIILVTKGNFPDSIDYYIGKCNNLGYFMEFVNPQELKCYNCEKYIEYCNCATKHEE